MIKKIMGMKKKAIKNLAKLSIWEFAVFKLCLVAFTLMLAVLIPALVTVKWWIYAIIWVAAYVFILQKLMKK